MIRLFCLAAAGSGALGLLGCAGQPETHGHTHDGAATHTHAHAQGSHAFHRPAGTGRAFFGPGDLYTFLATGDETDHAYFQFEAIVAPGGGPPPHIHHGEDETFYLAEGSLEMQLGDKSVIVNAGDYINVPRGTAHGFRNIGTTPAKLVVTFVPAGMEKYFEAVFPIATDRTATPPPITPALIEKMQAEAPAHRVEFIPPEKAPKR